MSDTKRYCIEEEGTSGWTQVEANASNLTKENCDIMLQRYIDLGYNPNRIRVRRTA